MIKIIEGKRYNTETATKIATYSYGYGGDFSAEYTVLYVTENGNFFISGEGGPKTRWAAKVDTCTWAGGEGLYPVSQIEARELAEQWDADPDIIAELFEVEDA